MLHSARTRQHKYLVTFKGKKLPNYCNICQTRALLTIREQMSASSVCWKLDPLLDPDISPVFRQLPPLDDQDNICRSHFEYYSKNENKAPDNLGIGALPSV